jgi:hypothetical protein
MEKGNVEKRDTEAKAADPKAYVKPTVTKHEAASLLVGSGCGCGYYISSIGGGAYYY